MRFSTNMKKVYFNPVATQDLRQILVGLLTWEKVQLSREHAREYVFDIYEYALSLSQRAFHIKCKYNEHLQYGAYILRYRRNNRTVWYIIYNVYDRDIYIEKILNNYLSREQTE